MPLLQKQHIKYTLPPKIENGYTQEVFIIRFTGEVFLNYSDYFARLSLYLRKQWTCELTQKSGLTYEQALISEKESRKQSEEKFPFVWKKLALQIIHYNQMGASDLISYLLEFFSNHIVLGERAFYEERGWVKVLNAIEEDTSSTGSPMKSEIVDGFVVKQDSDALYHETKYKGVEGDSVTLLNHRFRCELFNVCGDGPSNIYLNINGVDLKRNKSFFTKVNFRKFIKDCSVKEPANNAPFIVKPELVTLFNLQNEPSPLIKDIFGNCSHSLSSLSDFKLRKKKNVIKFPMDDQLILGLSEQYKRLDVPDFPTLKFDFYGILPKLIDKLLTSYTFLNTFTIPLSLSPFVLDDFCKSLIYIPQKIEGIEEEVDNDGASDDLGENEKHNVLLVEIFGQLLSHACLETDIKYSKAYRPDNDILVQNEDKCKFEILFNNLSENEKACVDQWWKWYPGRWHTGFKNGGTARSSKEIPSCARMKAFEIALITQQVVNEEVPLNLKNENAKLEGNDFKGVYGSNLEKNGTVLHNSVKADCQKFDKEASLVEESSTMVHIDSPVVSEATSDVTKDFELEEKKLDEDFERSIKKLCFMVQQNFFFNISVEEKILIISLLINEHVMSSKVIIDYIGIITMACLNFCLDKCADESVDLRKELREVVKEKKGIEANLQEFDNLNEETDIAAGIYVDHTVDNKVDNVEELNADSNLNTARRTSTRVELKREEELKRDQEERDRVLAFCESKERRKELQIRTQERRKMEAELVNYLKKEHQLLQSLYFTNAALNLFPLGIDRNFRSYYWFDADLGSVPLLGGFDAISSKIKPKSISGLDWSTGKLFVVEENKNNEEFERTYGYVDNPEEVDQLLGWLDQRGINESQLIKNIEKVVEPLAVGMVKRKEDLEGNIPIYQVSGRWKTRNDSNPHKYYETFFEYKNRLAGK
ncbi:hypothetical protein HK099_008666 [Clydaea vesicula]|uniref:WAC domain-containing protein n=1 Tax=Clydaea vesicula TaxID=447962 RepID=A0AAD5XXP6_9FUNG|nr:hypothetical protein HK099_008666 [Clydaea vesicula]